MMMEDKRMHKCQALQWRNAGLSLTHLQSGAIRLRSKGKVWERGISASVSFLQIWHRWIPPAHIVLTQLEVGGSLQDKSTAGKMPSSPWARAGTLRFRFGGCFFFSSFWRPAWLLLPLAATPHHLCPCPAKSLPRTPPHCGLGNP